MYEATKAEREQLTQVYDYNPEAISDKARKGISVSIATAIIVGNYQADLQAIRKNLKKWWQFWK